MSNNFRIMQINELLIKNYKINRKIIKYYKKITILN